MFECQRSSIPVILIVSEDAWLLENTVDADTEAWFALPYEFRACDLDQADWVIGRLDDAGRPLALCLVDVGEDEEAAGGFLERIGPMHPFAPRAARVDADQVPWAIDALKRRAIDRYVTKDCEIDELKNVFEVLLARYESSRKLQAAVEGRLGHHIFVTGATGFLGTHLVHEMLRCTDAKVTCLTRGSVDTPYDQRLPFTAKDYPGRLEFLEGDVTEPNLGLTPAQQRYLEDSVDEVWHLAAITSFSERLRDQIMSANMQGTAAVVALATRLKHLVRYSHVSTAYVAGRHIFPHVSREELSASPPAFKNPYEESKWHAERIVAASGLPYVIYRPSILIGESYSGRSDGKTLYGAAKVLRLARSTACAECTLCDNGSLNSLRVAGTATATLNVIPVDWVVDQFLRLRAADPAAGSVFHVVHPNPVKVRELMKAIADTMEIKKWQFVPQLTVDGLCWAEAIVYKGMRVFHEYIAYDDPVFDRAHTVAALSDADCAPLSLDFLKFCIQSYCEQHEDPREVLARVEPAQAR